MSICKDCNVLKTSIWKIKNPEKAAVNSKNMRIKYSDNFEKGGPSNKSKICPSCGVLKAASEFVICSTSSTGRRAFCRACSNYKSRYTNAQGRDKERGFVTCSKSEFYSIISAPCLYCGFLGPNGPDRIDNSRGYELGNIVSCCDFCNVARSDHFSVEEMKLEIGPAIKRIRELRNKEKK